MKKILVVESSPLQTDSFSNKLSKEIIASLRQSSGNAEVKVRNLITNTPPLLTKLEFGAYSAEAIQEVMDADTIIVNIPMHNFSMPAVLKAWIDQICVAGKTFSYTAEGPKGLVTGKKVYLSIATGGIYSDHQNKGGDFIENYMKALFSFLGMTDVETFRVEGLAYPNLKETALPTAIEKVHAHFKK